jgi:hypothetical protein
MKIVILPSVRDDLEAGFQYFEHQQEFLGGYFLDSLFSDIGSLRLYAGIHPKVSGNHRLLSKRLPYAVYYTEESGTVFVKAVLDCSRDSAWSGQELRAAEPGA